MQTNNRTPEQSAAYIETLEDAFDKAQAVIASRPVSAVEACEKLLGEHPEDAISPIKSASDALGWLEEIFKTIEKEALHEHNGFRIQSLAEAGAYLASDLSNYTGGRHEAMLARLRAAGAASSQGTPA